MLILLMGACAGSKKFDYQTAYKFSYYNYHKAGHENQAISEETIAEPVLEASAGHPSPQTITEDNPKPEMPDVRVNTEIHEKPANFNKEAFVAEYKSMSRQEKKAFKKELRAKLRELKKNPANTSDVKNVSMTQAEGDYLWLAILLGGVGLVLLILGAIFAVGFLTVIGALGIVAGAVFFILEFT